MPGANKYTYASIEERFLSKVEKADTGCWLWRGGYGGANEWGVRRPQFYMDGRVNSAARASLVIFKGTFEADRYALHTCDVVPCVNPDHLYWGTPQQNVDDRRERGKPFSDEGMANAKLTRKEVARIRFGGENVAALSRELRISKSNIWEIRRGKTWVHIADPFVL